MKKAILVVVLSALGGCDFDPFGTEVDPGEQVPTSIRIQARGMTLEVGESSQVGAWIRDQSGRIMGGLVSWSISDPSVARLTEVSRAHARLTEVSRAHITALSPGEAVLTARFQDLEDTIIVRVQDTASGL